MKFKKEVQLLFEKAGWHPGRNVKEKFDEIPRFEEFPDFVKDFLYEYGDLEVETYRYPEDDVVGVINTKALLLGYFKIDKYLDEKSSFGEHIKTFPIAYYDLDNAGLECDIEGKVYMSSDFPNLMSDNFVEGIERVMMEDYSETVYWDKVEKAWVKDDF